MDQSGNPLAVLVVEDEPLIRMDVAATIEEAGFRVYVAANADQAVELLAFFSPMSICRARWTVSSLRITRAHIGP